MTDLARAVGISPALMSNYQLGRRTPPGESVEALAHELRYPEEFFYGPELDDLDTNAVSFRSLSRLRAQDREAALGAAQIARLLAAWIDVRYEVPRPSIPEHSGADPEEAADAVRSAWGLGQGPIGHVVGQLEAKGLRVFSLQEDCSEMDAFCFWDGSTPFVFLNAFKSGERSRFDAAHELGHLVLHRREALSRNKAAEKEANEFASAFLMPRAAFVASAPQVISLNSVLRMKQTWGVSVAAATVRLNRLGLIGEWDYRMLFQQLSARGWRTAEPEPMRREQSRLLESLLADLKTQGITLRDLARDIGVPASEVRALTFGLSEAPSEPEAAFATTSHARVGATEPLRLVQGDE
jgi:Zn-dependent peptidase ImmA (M78 family)